MDVSGSESPVFGTPGQNSPQEGLKRVGFHPPLYTENHHGVVCSYNSNIVQAQVLELFRAKRPPLIPDIKV